jgi:hypothetical protein
VVQATRACTANIHSRPLPYRIKALKHLRNFDRGKGREAWGAGAASAVGPVLSVYMWGEFAHRVKAPEHPCDTGGTGGVGCRGVDKRHTRMGR